MNTGEFRAWVWHAIAGLSLLVSWRPALQARAMSFVREGQAARLIFIRHARRTKDDHTIYHHPYHQHTPNYGRKPAPWCTPAQILTNSTSVKYFWVSYKAPKDVLHYESLFCAQM